MRVAFTQVGPPIRELWLNLIRNLRADDDTVFVFDPSEAFYELLKREGLEDCIVRFNGEDERPIPIVDGTTTDLIDYNTRYLGKSRDELCREYWCFYRNLDDLDIDVVVFWNDINIGKVAASEKDVATVFIENGYLPGTIQIDHEGVNKNASFADLDFDELLDVSPGWIPETDQEIERYSIDDLGLPRKFTALTRMALRGGNVRWVVEEEFSKLSARIRSLQVDGGDEELPTDYAFLPFQVHDDTQVLYNSPFVSDMREFLDLVEQSLSIVDASMDIVVKEHPADIGRIQYDDLRRDHPGVTWLRRRSIEDVVDNARLITTINSSVGFQALARHRPVVTLGKTFYRNNPYVENPTSASSVPEAVERALSTEIDPEGVDAYVEAFRDRIFVAGGIGSFDTGTLRQIISYIRNR